MHAAGPITAGAFSTTPAAQAARTFASPGPSPSYSPHPQLASDDSSSAGLRAAGLRATEIAASPVSPQAATEAAVLAMRSETTLYGGTDARDAQTAGSNLPPLPTASTKRDFDPVSVVESSPAVETLVRGLDSVPAPVSIPTPSVTVSQEPLSAQTPKAETAARSMPADYKSIQQTDLAVPMAPQAPTMLRPVGAFSYTAPAAATRVPPSTDRYIPAIGFSPSRARVARDPPADPPADPFLGHAQKPSYTVDPLPAVPQRTILLTSSDAPAVCQQKAFDVPPVLPSTMSAALMDRSLAQPTGAVYGPGVTSTPIATDAAISSHPAMSTAPAPALTQTAPTGITYTAGPPPMPPVEQLVDSTGHLGKPTRQLHGIGFVPADVAQLPMLTTAAGIGSVPSPVLPTGPQEAAPFSPPGGLVLSGLAPESQGIAPGPLQAGQTMPAGPVAEGTQHSLQASDSDAWSDADSVTTETLSEACHERSAQPGPVCEGIETNSDMWSDSASSDPGTPISGSQATVGVSYHSCMYPLLGLLVCTCCCCHCCPEPQRSCSVNSLVSSCVWCPLLFLHVSIAGAAADVHLLLLLLLSRASKQLLMQLLSQQLRLVSPTIPACIECWSSLLQLLSLPRASKQLLIQLLSQLLLLLFASAARPDARPAAAPTA